MKISDNNKMPRKKLVENQGKSMIKGYKFSRTHEISGERIAIAHELTYNNAVIINVIKDSYLTILGDNIPVLAEMILSVHNNMIKYVNHEPCDKGYAGEEEMLTDWNKQSAILFGKCKISSKLYAVRAEEPCLLNSIIIESNETSKVINITTDNAIEVASVLLGIYLEIKKLELEQ